MYICWGHKNVTTKINDRYFFCPQCDSNRLGSIKRIRKYFALYSIPIIPLSLRCQYIECPICEYQDIEKVFEKSGSINSFLRRTKEFFSVGFFVLLFFSMIIVIKDHLFSGKKIQEQTTPDSTHHLIKNSRLINISNNTSLKQNIEVELKQGSSYHKLKTVSLDEFDSGQLTLNESGILRLLINEQDVIFDISGENLEYFVEINEKNEFEIYMKPIEAILT